MSAPLAILAIGDVCLRERMRSTLVGLRWRVLEACSGADALAQLEPGTSSTVVMDPWFPDLEISEFVQEVESSFPKVDLVSTSGVSERLAKARNSRHGEVLYALRLNHELSGSGAQASLRIDRGNGKANEQMLPDSRAVVVRGRGGEGSQQISSQTPRHHGDTSGKTRQASGHGDQDRTSSLDNAGLSEFVGRHPVVLEMCRRIRLVAGRDTNVLVQGPSGSGKELVARALHRLSLRSHKPFVSLNCAAIPESLLESELFGHTKGSFTGALQSRTGRIEAADRGTLFLDEIGEMPLSLQAKLLRFLESGEIQRIGENGTHYVDVRVIAASNQQLGLLSTTGGFRLDLFYRLAVFLIETPALITHMDDLPALAEYFLQKVSTNPTPTRFAASALDKMSRHRWPGNVRELAHVIERSFILADDRPEISSNEIEFAGFCSND